MYNYKVVTLDFAYLIDPKDIQDRMNLKINQLAKEGWRFHSIISQAGIYLLTFEKLENQTFEYKAKDDFPEF